MNMDFRTFTNIVLTVAILLGAVFLKTWTTAIQDCGEICVECQEVRDFMNKTCFTTPIERSDIGYSASIRVEMNISPELEALVACTNKQRFDNMTEFLECQEIAPMFPA